MSLFANAPGAAGASQSPITLHVPPNFCWVFTGTTSPALPPSTPPRPRSRRNGLWLSKSTRTSDKTTSCSGATRWTMVCSQPTWIPSTPTSTRCPISLPGTSAPGDAYFLSHENQRIHRSWESLRRPVCAERSQGPVHIPAIPAIRGRYPPWPDRVAFRRRRFRWIFPAGPQHHPISIHRQFHLDAWKPRLEVRRQLPPLRRQRSQLLLQQRQDLLLFGRILQTVKHARRQSGQLVTVVRGWLGGPVPQGR